MKKQLLIPTLAVLTCYLMLAVSGCSRAEWSQIHSFDTAHKVTLYAGTNIVRTWTTTGSVQEHDGGMCFFQDAATDMPVYIYGTWTVEIIK